VINKSVIKQRMPYYVKCSHCGKLFADWTMLDIIADTEDWIIDKNGNVLCDDCINEILQEQDIEEMK
jgi:phage terminase large subunit GpA-like protein